MKQTNILIEASAFDHFYQGTSTYIYQLYKEINQLAPKVSFFFISHKKETITEVFKNFSNTQFLYYKSTNKFLQLYLEIPKIIKEYNIDYAHFQYVMPFKTNAKNIITVHDVLIFSHSQFFKKRFRIPRKLLYNYSIKNADYIATVSKFSKNAIEQKFDICNNIFASNAVNFSDYKHLEKKSSRVVIKNEYGINKFILYVSRYEKRKNHHFLLKAFKELNLQKEYKLVFIGAGVIKAFEALQNNSLVLIENIPFSDLKHFYASTDLFVYPSIAEGFGFPPIEALAAGSKVICSNATAMKEFTFFKGRFFSPFNLADLKKQIIKALEDYPMEEIKKQKEIAQKKYNWTKSALEFLDFLGVE